MLDRPLFSIYFISWIFVSKDEYHSFTCLECNEVSCPVETCGKMVCCFMYLNTVRDNVGVLLTPLTEKLSNGKMKILLCNDIVDSVSLVC